MSTDALPLPDPALLPDDVAVLKQLIVQLLEELRLRDERLQRQEHHMHLLLKRLYGSTSEKFDPRQGVLFDAQAGEGEAAASPPVPPPTTSPTSKNRDKHGRGRIPGNIERKEEIHDLSEAEMAALGGAENLVELPSERSEQLDWRPSTLFVTVHVRKKYARKVPLPESGLTLAEQNVAVARKPAEAIPGGLAGPGLMAQVIVSKGADHLPLHRLEGIFKRQGVRISRQTMDGWWLATAEFLQPLYTLAIRVVLASHVIHTDDTSVKVRDAWRKQKYTGHFWPYVGDALHPLTVFDYTTNHKRDGPAAFLKNYRGYLQADAFNGYDGIYLESAGRIIEVACWAHARRRFHESRRLDAVRMETALAWIGKLYAVEKDLRERCQGAVGEPHAGPACRPDRRRAARALPAALGQLPCLAGRGGTEGLAQERGPWGDGLHALELGGPLRVPGGRLVGHRQQRRREFAAGPLYWTPELAVLWERPRRPRGGDPFQPVGLVQASRP